MHASAGTGIRPPDAFEIAFTDNPRLAPERSRSVDLGFEQALAGGRVTVDATCFYNRYDDLIVAVGRSLQDYSRYRTDNISNARARGVETALALRTRGGIEAHATYSFLDTAILAVDRSSGAAPAPFAVGDRLIRRPRHQASADVLWRHRRATLYVRAGGRSRVLDVEPNWGASGGLFHSPGFAVADAGAAIHLNRQADVVARVDNLFDRRYESVLRLPCAPPRVLRRSAPCCGPLTSRTSTTGAPERRTARRPAWRRDWPGPRCPACRTSASRSSAAGSWASSGPTGPARPRCCACWPAC